MLNFAEMEDACLTNCPDLKRILYHGADIFVPRVILSFMSLENIHKAYLFSREKKCQVLVRLDPLDDNIIEMMNFEHFFNPVDPSVSFEFRTEMLMKIDSTKPYVFERMAAELESKHV